MPRQITFLFVLLSFSLAPISSLFAKEDFDLSDYGSGGKTDFSLSDFGKSGKKDFDLSDHGEDERADEAEYSDFYRQDDRIPWALVPAVSGGYNQLVEGYEGYDNLGSLGVDLYVFPGRSLHETPDWKNRFLFRCSLDYFPLQVPEGVHSITEDIYGFNAAVLYRFYSFERPEMDQWVPFIGGGAGGYLDRVELDTPATGKVAGNHNSFGFNLALGLFSPRIGSWAQLVPEVRLHHLKILDSSWSTNIVYQVALALPFGRRDAGRAP